MLNIAMFLKCKLAYIGANLNNCKIGLIKCRLGSTWFYSKLYKYLHSKTPRQNKNVLKRLMMYSSIQYFYTLYIQSLALLNSRLSRKLLYLCCQAQVIYIFKFLFQAIHQQSQQVVYLSDSCEKFWGRQSLSKMFV